MRERSPEKKNLTGAAYEIVRALLGVFLAALVGLLLLAFSGFAEYYGFTVFPELLALGALACFALMAAFLLRLINGELIKARLDFENAERKEALLERAPRPTPEQAAPA